jgi:TolA-binding protein
VKQARVKAAGFNNPLLSGYGLLVFLLMLVFSLSASNVKADFYEAGLMAYVQGDYNRAEQAFRLAVKEGHGGAEHMLMRIFSEHKTQTKNAE